MKFTMLSNILLAIRENGTYEPFSAEAWEYSGQMTLLGMVMVFAVLAILWLVLSIFKIFFAGKTQKAQKPQKTEAVKRAVEKAAAPAPAQTVATVNTRDEELIAVLTAAVAAYMSEESGTEVSVDGLRVVSFRRVSGGRSWNTK